GTLYARGDPMPADPERAASLLGRACDAEVAGACRELAALVMADRGRALELEVRGCALGDGAACLEVARLDPKQAARTIIRACKLDVADACGALERGLADLEDVAQLEEVCAAGSGAVCLHLGTLLTRSDKAGAARAFDRACQAHHALACQTLGKMYVDADG